jgi:hypothetical protein
MGAAAVIGIGDQKGRSARSAPFNNPDSAIYVTEIFILHNYNGAFVFPLSTRRWFGHATGAIGVVSENSSAWAASSRLIAGQ